MSRERILEIDSRPTASSDGLPTIFDTVFETDAGKGQIRPSIDELSADSLLLLMAGTDTTAHALTISTYHVLKDPEIMRKLQAELREAIPRKDSWVQCAELEKLQYLRGVIKESLRWSSGTPGQLPRVVPSEGAVLCGRRVAPGVSARSLKAHLGLIDCALLRPWSPPLHTCIIMTPTSLLTLNLIVPSVGWLAMRRLVNWIRT